MKRAARGDPADGANSRLLTCRRPRPKRRARRARDEWFAAPSFLWSTGGSALVRRGRRISAIRSRARSINTSLSASGNRIARARGPGDVASRTPHTHTEIRADTVLRTRSAGATAAVVIATDPSVGPGPRATRRRPRSRSARGAGARQERLRVDEVIDDSRRLGRAGRCRVCASSYQAAEVRARPSPRWCGGRGGLLDRRTPSPAAAAAAVERAERAEVHARDAEGRATITSEAVADDGRARGATTCSSAVDARLAPRAVAGPSPPRRPPPGDAAPREGFSAARPAPELRRVHAGRRR